MCCSLTVRARTHTINVIECHSLGLDTCAHNQLKCPLLTPPPSLPTTPFLFACARNRRPLCARGRAAGPGRWRNAERALFGPDCSGVCVSVRACVSVWDLLLSSIRLVAVETAASSSSSSSSFLFLWFFWWWWWWTCSCRETGWRSEQVSGLLSGDTRTHTAAVRCLLRLCRVRRH